jgi:hypothetical protein
MPKVLVYSEHSSNRFQYVLTWLFTPFCSFQITHDVTEANAHEGPLIYYGSVDNGTKAIQIPDSGYLWTREVASTLPEAALVHFPITHLNTDIFSFIFFSLTRAEEYEKVDRDTWGRFKAENSMAYKNGFLQLPYVDLVSVALFECIHKKWPSFQKPISVYSRQITYDIDVAWAYLHRSFFRHTYGIIRDIFRRDFSSIRERWKVLHHQKEDPYFTFSRLLKMHAALGDSPIFFCLMGNKTSIDRAVGITSPAFKQLVRDLSCRYILGLHPSKKSGSKMKELKREYSLLCAHAEKEIVHSRQHYLLLNLPDTYHRLIDIGVKNDYSMGYASTYGFRAGTCFPFLWYDIKKDICTTLMVHPFQAMDITFWVYGQNTEEKILSVLKDIENQCKAVGGTFTFIAHNSSFSGPGTWNKWEEIYVKFLNNENK